MEEKLLNMLNGNAVGGTVFMAVLAIFYKMWRILKSDRKVDDLDNNERSFRDELRKEITELKADKQRLEDVNQRLLFELSDIKASIRFCKGIQRENCPVINNLTNQQ